MLNIKFDDVVSDIWIEHCESLFYDKQIKSKFYWKLQTYQIGCGHPADKIHFVSGDLQENFK